MAGHENEISKVGDGANSNKHEDSSARFQTESQKHGDANSKDLEQTRLAVFGKGGLNESNSAPMQRDSAAFKEQTAKHIEGSPEQLRETIENNNKAIKAAELHVANIEARIKKVQEAEKAHHELMNAQRGH